MERRTRAATTGSAARRMDLIALLRAKGIRSTAVLDAMSRVRREAFVPPELRAAAYDDRPLSIGHEQTISQPYIVARMLELSRVQAGERALEIGAGSGYTAAVLAEIVSEVHTVERIPALASRAREQLARLGYDHVHVHRANGSLGWPDASPYDAVIVTAGAPRVPDALVDQLGHGGRLVIPVSEDGGLSQVLLRVTSLGARTVRETFDPVRFVPLVGRGGYG